MSDDLTIATLQHVPTPNNVTASLQRLENAAAESAANGCKLLVVPECSITGYNQSLNTMQQVALSADGSTVDAIAEICRKFQIALAYGFAEKDDDQYFNTVQINDASGNTIARYRKTHLWGDLDRRLFSKGEELSPVVSIDGWQVGILICYDVEFPENVRALALAGAELIIVPTGLMQPWRDVAERVVPVRAYENQIYIAYCNYCDAEADIIYEGRSCIVGPDGADLDRAQKKPTLLSATLTKASITTNREALPYHRDRRPALYSSLSQT